MKDESLALKAYTEIRRKILSSQISPKTRLKEGFLGKKTLCKPDGNSRNLDPATRGATSYPRSIRRIFC